LGESGHDLLGGTEEDPLPFAYWQVKAPDYAEGDFLVLESEFSAGRGGEGRILGLEEGGVDSCVDDMEFFWIDPARMAVMAFGNRGGRVIVALAQNLGDKCGNGNDGVGVGEKMVSAEGGARALGEMPGENDQGSGLDEAGGEEGGPVVVAVVGMKDAGADDTQKPCEAQNLEWANVGQFMKLEFGGFWREWGISGAGDLHTPAPLGQSLGEGQALIVGSAPPETGVELQDSGDQRGG